MLVIRDIQMAVLRNHLLLERARGHVRQQGHFADIEPGELEQLLQELMRHSQRFGATSVADLQRFIDLAAEHGCNFEQRPECRWIIDILCDRDITSCAARLDHVQATRARSIAAIAVNTRAEALFHSRFAFHDGEEA